MNKATFLRLVEHPESISAADTQALEEVTAAFPYFGLAHMLLAKATHVQGHMLASQKLRKAAVFATDRNQLKRLIHPEQPVQKPAYSADIPVVDSVPDSPLKDEVASDFVSKAEPVITVKQESVKEEDIAATPVEIIETDEVIIAQEIAEISEESHTAELPVVAAAPVSNTETVTAEEIKPEVISEPETEDIQPVAAEEETSEVDSKLEINQPQPVTLTPSVDLLQPEVEQEEFQAVDREVIPDEKQEQESILEETSTEKVESTEFDTVSPVEDIDEAQVVIAEEINAVVISEPVEETIQREESDIATTPEDISAESEVRYVSDVVHVPVAEVDSEAPSLDIEELIGHPVNEIGTQPEIGETHALQDPKPEVDDPETELRKVFADPQLSYALGSSRMGECLVAHLDTERDVPFYPEVAVPVRKEIAPVTSTPAEELESEPAPVFAIQQELIDSFLKQSPRIRAQAANQLKSEAQEDLSAKSSKLSTAFASENLAQIFVKQGKFKKAIKIYQQLQLKMPEKSEYFASQIFLLQQQF